MRASLPVCLALFVLAAGGCHAPAATRAPQGPGAASLSTPAARAVETPATSDARPAAAAEPRDETPRVAAVLAAPGLPPGLPPAEPALATDAEVFGTIVAHEGDRITIRIDDDAAFTAGERAQLLRHFERKLGSATVTGWLDVARVTVLAHDGRAIELSIDEETARVMVNGRKQDQFRPGFLVRLEAA